MASDTTDQRSNDKAFRHGFHGIPNPQKRATMSPEDLAIELSEQKPGTPPYILLEHELNLRLAKEQAQLNHRSAKLNATFTVIGAIVGAGMTAIFSSPPPQAIVDCQCPNIGAAAIAAPPSGIVNKHQSAVPLPAVGKETPAPTKSKQPSSNGKPNP